MTQNDSVSLIFKELSKELKELSKEIKKKNDRSKYVDIYIQQKIFIGFNLLCIHCLVLMSAECWVICSICNCCRIKSFLCTSFGLIFVIDSILLSSAWLTFMVGYAFFFILSQILKRFLSHSLSHAFKYYLCIHIKV